MAPEQSLEQSHVFLQNWLLLWSSETNGASNHACADTCSGA